jgi:hypothetical protein
MLPDVVRATVGAALGDLGGLFDQRGAVFDATLTFDGDARLPGGTTFLRPGTHDAVVRFAPDGAESVPRTLCVKVPGAYGPGRDQDFLFATSGDGAPLHHAVLSSTSAEGLYSSLWLYLAGVQPVAFGARIATAEPKRGDTVEFLLGGVLSRFRRIGTLTLGERAPDGDVEFSAGHAGGGLRALPPALLYRG